MSRARAGFKFLEIARADAAFEARGRTLGRLFESAGRALTSVMADLEGIRTVQSRRIELKAESAERLLFEFLQELIYLKDAEGLLFGHFILTVDASPWRLKGSLEGEPIDPKRHRLGADVKAVTLHRFGLAKEDGVWRATVTVDI